MGTIREPHWKRAMAAAAARAQDEVTDWEEDEDQQEDAGAYNDAYNLSPWDNSQLISRKVKFLMAHVESWESDEVLTSKQKEVYVTDALKHHTILKDGARTGSVGDAAVLLKAGRCGPTAKLKAPERPREDDTEEDTGTAGSETGDTSETARKLLEVVKGKVDAGIKAPTDEELAKELEESERFVPDEEESEDDKTKGGPKLIKAPAKKKKKKIAAVDRPKLMAILSLLQNRYQQLWFVLQRNKGLLSWILYLDSIGWDDLSSLASETDGSQDGSGLPAAPLSEEDKNALNNDQLSRFPSYGGLGAVRLERELEDLMEQIRDTRTRIKQRTDTIKEQKKQINMTLKSAGSRIGSSRGGSADQSADDAGSQTGSITHGSEAGAAAKAGSAASVDDETASNQAGSSAAEVASEDAKSPAKKKSKYAPLSSQQKLALKDKLTQETVDAQRRAEAGKKDYLKMIKGLEERYGAREAKRKEREDEKIKREAKKKKEEKKSADKGKKKKGKGDDDGIDVESE